VNVVKKELFKAQKSCCESKVKGETSAVRLEHPLEPRRLAGDRRREDVGVADAQLQTQEAGGGGDAAVPDVGLLNRVAVFQGVNAHPGLIWWRDERTLGQLKQTEKFLSPSLFSYNLTVYFCCEVAAGGETSARSPAP